MFLLLPLGRSPTRAATKTPLRQTKTAEKRAQNWSIITLSVRNMVKRSMPTPQPAVGGRPYFIAVQNSSSCTSGTSKHHATNRKTQQTNWRMVDEAPCESPLPLDTTQRLDITNPRVEMVGILKQHVFNQSPCTRIQHLFRTTTLT